MFCFVGERPSNKALRMGVTWKDGRLAAKTLFDALESLGLKPIEQAYLNLFPNDGPLVPRQDAVRAIRRLAKKKTIVALGKLVGNSLDRLGLRHVKLVHPAARGKIRKKSRYQQHVKDNLGV